MNSSQKIAWGFGMLGIAAPLYLIPNHYPILTPTELPLTPMDQWIPFLPESIWVYLSEYPMIISAYFMLEHPFQTKPYLKNIASVLVLSFVIFTVFPTTYPRQAYPLPDGLDSFSRFLFELQRENDSPLNCFPSLHVATVFMSSWSLRENKKWFFPYLAWASLIAISTLTTKQHYFWDLIGGFVLAFIFKASTFGVRSKSPN